MTALSRLVLTMGVLAMGASVASAEALTESRTCQEPPHMEMDPKASIMKVTSGDARVYFIKNREESNPRCPDRSEGCRRKAFVVPGDEVLVSEIRDGMACATYIAPNPKVVKGEFTQTDGFLPADALEAVPATAPKREDWIGHWSRSAEGEIDISAGPLGALAISGEATWGAGDSDAVERGSVHMGELDGEASPIGNRLFFGEGYDGTKPPHSAVGDCSARMHLYGRYLVVEDNGGCGGNNVSFNGVYVRTKRR